MECVDKIIRKDMMDPTNGKRIKEADIIRVQRGGTGYSSTNQVTAEVKGPAMQAWHQSDLLAGILYLNVILSRQKIIFLLIK